MDEEKVRKDLAGASVESRTGAGCFPLGAWSATPKVTFEVRDSPTIPGPPPLMQITFLACCAHYPGGPIGADGYSLARSRSGLFPIRSAFPAPAPGRRPHCRFRGLLKLHTRYGLPRLLAHLKWTFSRGFGQPGYPDSPLDSYRI